MGARLEAVVAGRGAGVLLRVGCPSFASDDLGPNERGVGWREKLGIGAGCDG